MRLPLTADLDSRDGLVDKDARLTNTLAEQEESGPVTQVRPGLVTAATSTGNAGGLVCYQGELLSVFGASLGAGILAGTGDVVLVDEPTWSGDVAGIDFRYINGGLFYSGENELYYTFDGITYTKLRQVVVGAVTYTVRNYPSFIGGVYYISSRNLAVDPYDLIILKSADLVVWEVVTTLLTPTSDPPFHDTVLGPVVGTSGTFVMHNRTLQEDHYYTLLGVLDSTVSISLPQVSMYYWGQYINLTEAEMPGASGIYQVSPVGGLTFLCSNVGEFRNVQYNEPEGVVIVQDRSAPQWVGYKFDSGTFTEVDLSGEFTSQVFVTYGDGVWYIAERTSGTWAASLHYGVGLEGPYTTVSLPDVLFGDHVDIDSSPGWFSPYISVTRLADEETITIQILEVTSGEPTIPATATLLPGTYDFTQSPL